MHSVSLDEIKNLASKSYNERAYFVLSKFLSDFTEEELKKCIDSAYTKEKFETESIAPVYKLNDTTYFLELWHARRFDPYHPTNICGGGVRPIPASF